MAGLQRSSETFRRSGSSGMVWEWDDKHLSGEIIKPSAGRGGATAAPRVERSRSTGGGHAGYRAAAGHDVTPAPDPPSPRVAVCGGCCPFFFAGGGDTAKTNKKKNRAKGGRRRH